MSDTYILDVEHLVAGYGRGNVLFDISLRVPKTGAIAVLGRNGAGKSTLLKTLAGDVNASDGSAVFDGQNIFNDSMEQRVHRGLGYVPQEQAVFSSLTVQDNLALGACTTTNRNNFDMALEFFPKLAGRLDQQAGTLSGGERKMLAISRAILGQPRLLMLDEPTEGVWMGVIEEIADRLTLLSKEIALIIVEQHVELALRVADSAYVIDRGEVALSGTSDEVQNHPDLERYLAP